VTPKCCGAGLLAAETVPSPDAVHGAHPASAQISAIVTAAVCPHGERYPFSIR
jgi:hypothetical protein